MFLYSLFSDITLRFETVDRQILQLQRQIRFLSNKLETSGHSAAEPSTTLSEDLPSPSTASCSSSKNPDTEESQAYIGPTSGAFRLQDVLSTIPMDPITRENATENSMAIDAAGSTGTCSTPVPKAMAIAELAINRVLCLIEFYEKAIGVIYPFIDTASLKIFARRVYQDPESRALVISTRPDLQLEWSSTRDIQVLKLVLATALVAEGGDSGRLGKRLAEIVIKNFGSRLDVFDIDLKEILIVTLISFYYNWIDNDVLAWRFIGFATRGILEMGLHRRETWDKRSGAFPGEIDRTWALRMFWCIYVLDRRWSFATGLPLAFRDNDLDADLPLPTSLSPYLDCMIKLDRIGEEVWELVGSQTGRSRQVSPEERAALTFRLHKWFSGISPELRLNDAPLNPQQRVPVQNEVQLLLYLNGKQMHISVYRDLILSANSVKDNFSEIADVTQHAKDIVQALQRLNWSTSIHTTVYNRFLLSALGALLLVICHAPSAFGETCREEFHLALRMLRTNRGNAFMSPRTRKLVQAIQRVSSQVVPAGNASAQPQNIWIEPTASNIPIDMMQGPIFEQFSLSNVDSTTSTIDGISDLTNFFESVGNTALSSGLQTEGLESLSDSQQQDTLQGRSQFDVTPRQQKTQHETNTSALHTDSNVSNSSWMNSIDIFGWHDDAAIAQAIGELL